MRRIATAITSHCKDIYYLPNHNKQMMIFILAFVPPLKTSETGLNDEAASIP